MTIEEFVVNIKKASQHRNREITNSYTIKSIWRWLKKNKFFGIVDYISERDFGHIIKTINKGFIQRMSEGHCIDFPLGMGRLELTKYDRKAEYKNGKLKNNYAIDWNNTFKLWYEDAEARENKTLVKTVAKFGYFILYNRKYASYKNKSFYQFFPNREFKREIIKHINNNDIDAVWS